MNIVTPQHTPAPGSCKLQFGRNCLVHHYYILNFSDKCPEVEKKSLKDTDPLKREDHEISNFPSWFGKIFDERRPTSDDGNRSPDDY